MIGLKKAIIAVLVAELVFFASVLVWVFGAGYFEDDHSPILIDGNDSFTKENGVTRGEGTVDDPYVISGWDIDASPQNGVDIRNT
ncbi:MAG: hypothetical protein MUC90_08625, partial [Thermoplasmata archaeon]|nr:hypothetical protein [Thermoplasmata archaeon]